MGSGTGRHLEIFLQHGFAAEGVEPSLYMMKEARDRGLSIRHGYIENQVYEELFDACTCLFAVANYVPPAKMRDFLRAVAAQVKQGGIVALEVWASSSVKPKSAQRRFIHGGKAYLRSVEPVKASGSEWTLDVKIIEDESDSIVSAEQHVLYRHRLDSIEREALRAGLSLISKAPLHLNKSDSFHQTFFFRRVPSNAYSSAGRRSNRLKNPRNS